MTRVSWLLVVGGSFGSFVAACGGQSSTPHTAGHAGSTTDAGHGASAGTSAGTTGGRAGTGAHGGRAGNDQPGGGKTHSGGTGGTAPSPDDGGATGVGGSSPGEAGSGGAGGAGDASGAGGASSAGDTGEGGTGAEAGARADGGAAGAAGAAEGPIVTAVATGGYHTCVLSNEGKVRCFGLAEHGQLGYANTNDIGDDETPASAGDVDVGGIAIQITAGLEHTCALLSDGTVRCWGRGEDGRLGYGNTDDIGDDETPASAGAVDVGGTVVQISAGYARTCALLDTGKVRCWGMGRYTGLGYGAKDDIGDDETPASVGDIDLGATAVQIAAGSDDTCAVLETGDVRCWGGNVTGALGLPGSPSIGDNEAPAVASSVDVGGSVVAVGAGSFFACVLLTDGHVRCWGESDYGRLGYGNRDDIGDDETPASAGNVDVGGEVKAISVGLESTCALLETGAVRCWGDGFAGQLGYPELGDTELGDNEAPSSAGDVDVGGTVTEVAIGGTQTCALLTRGSVRCWGAGNFGQNGHPGTLQIGDDEAPASVGDVAVFALP